MTRARKGFESTDVFHHRGKHGGRGVKKALTQGHAEASQKTGLTQVMLPLLQRLGLLHIVVWIIESYRALGAGRLAIGPDGLPVPPPRLIVRVSGSAEATAFLESGQRAAESVRAALDRAGAHFDSLAAILDFGCGCGRVARNWQGLKARVYGSDLSEPAIKWARANLPFGEFSTNALEPPLSYPDAHFDLVYALSVLTHLPVAMQLSWRDELRRVLRPGGYLLLTLHGEAYLDQLTPEEQRVYAGDECVVRWAQVAGSNLCGTYHPPAFVRDKLAQGWEFIEHLPCGTPSHPEQDLIVLRKPANSPTETLAGGRTGADAEPVTG